ncbi:MAG: amidohydrolase family protein [Pseudomonadales bacterium]|nr:amidohydrolase family protein [Pseudomonadales bacterium]
MTRALVAPEAGVEVLAGQSAVVALDDERDALIDGSNAVFVYLGEKGKEYSGGSRARGLLDLLTALREAELYSDNRRAYDRRQLKALDQSEVDLRALLPVLAGDKPLALYIDRAADIEAVIGELEEFDLDLVIVGGREAWKVRALLADKEIPVVLNPLDNVPSSFDRIGARLDNAALLSEAGVTIAFMTEDLYTEFRMLTQGAGVAVAWGLPWEEALAAITANPARIWGIEDYGTIEPGQDADIVIWDDDPLEVTSAPTTIFIRGELIDTTSRQTLLRDRYRDLDSTEPPFGYR